MVRLKHYIHLCEGLGLFHNLSFNPRLTKLFFATRLTKGGATPYELEKYTRLRYAYLVP